MSYTGKSVINSAIAHREIELLQQGLSYKAVAEIVGARVGSLKERNRLVYRVDIYQAFRERIARDGIPNQLSVGDDFGHYFSGLFDGEGCIVAFHRIRARGKPYPEFRLALQVTLRDDDADVIEYVHRNLGGVVHRMPQRGGICPTISWKMERIKELAEQIVPLLDKYPLRSKKGREYQIWRPLVIERYMATLGGKTQRGGPTAFEPDFLDAITAIQTIRKYPRRLDIVEVRGALGEEVNHLGGG